MSTPADLEQFKQVLSVKEDALGFLDEAAWYQARRWELLRRVVDDACWQYVMMRLDAAEEKEKDQGVPMWLSVVLAVGLAAIPFAAETTKLLGKTTNFTKRHIASAEQALAGATAAAAKSPVLTTQIMKAEQIIKEMKQTDATLVAFVKKVDPVLSNTAKETTKELSKSFANNAFKQKDSGGKIQFARSTTVPLVDLRQYLNQWIDIRIRAEHLAQTIERKRIRDLADIAISSEPDKDAKAKEKARTPKLPHTNKAALTELTEARDKAALSETGSESIPDITDLRDLQLLIEASIWASTYDFSPIYKPEKKLERGGEGEAGPEFTFPAEVVGAPLPAALWKRLIERYIDPDEGKPYNEVIFIDRLGTKDKPTTFYYKYLPVKHYGPEARLSFYFSQVLYPLIKTETSEVIGIMNRATARGAAPGGNP
jgi:hypothetical protein